VSRSQGLADSDTRPAFQVLERTFGILKVFTKSAIRTRGRAASYEETSTGVWGIAVPVLSATDVVCTVGIAGPNPRLSDEWVERDVRHPRCGHGHRPDSGAQRAAGDSPRRSYRSGRHPAQG
jgi:Bacterial transcriptional regulator